MYHLVHSELLQLTCIQRKFVQLPAVGWYLDSLVRLNLIHSHWLLVRYLKHLKQMFRIL